ncbi:MAG: alpha/beta hydrolase [Streptosporangiaceae bacterium]|jgi:pimeloyl-ACP methyl ester carboxylesterase
MEFVAETPAGPIAGHTGGDPGGPPVLLLHGGPGMTDYMDDLLGGELGGWRTISYQQRGLEPSATDGPFTVEQHVADAIAVLDAVGVERAVLLGHSWGGHLALQIAAAHPDRVVGLVSVDGLGAAGDDGGMTALGQRLAEGLPPESMTTYAELGQRLSGPEPSDEDATAWLRLLWPQYFADPAAALPYPPSLRLSLAVNAQTNASVLESLANGFASTLKSVTVPAVFLLGERSPMPVSQGEQTAALLPDATVRVVPGAGHLVWYEVPDSVAEALATVSG